MCATRYSWTKDEQHDSSKIDMKEVQTWEASKVLPSSTPAITMIDCTLPSWKYQSSTR